MRRTQSEHNESGLPLKADIREDRDLRRRGQNRNLAAQRTFATDHEQSGPIGWLTAHEPVTVDRGYDNLTHSVVRIFWH